MELFSTLWVFVKEPTIQQTTEFFIADLWAKGNTEMRKMGSAY